MGLGCYVGSVLQDPLKEVGFESRVNSVRCQARMGRGEGNTKEEKEGGGRWRGQPRGHRALMLRLVSRR